MSNKDGIIISQFLGVDILHAVREVWSNQANFHQLINKMQVTLASEVIKQLFHVLSVLADSEKEYYAASYPNSSILKNTLNSYGSKDYSEYK